jgi:hypothetical protein
MADNKPLKSADGSAPEAEKMSPSRKPATDPRDDLHDRVAGHREKLQSFFAAKQAGMARDALAKRKKPK